MLGVAGEAGAGLAGGHGLPRDFALEPEEVDLLLLVFGIQAGHGFLELGQLGDELSDLAWSINRHGGWLSGAMGLLWALLLGILDIAHCLRRRRGRSDHAVLGGFLRLGAAG